MGDSSIEGRSEKYAVSNHRAQSLSLHSIENKDLHYLVRCMMMMLMIQIQQNKNDRRKRARISNVDQNSEF